MLKLIIKEDLVVEARHGEVNLPKREYKVMDLKQISANAEYLLTLVDANHNKYVVIMWLEEEDDRIEFVIK